MSICPKNKHSKARRDSHRASWKMGEMNLVKVQQVRRFDDASQSLQGLRSYNKKEIVSVDKAFGTGLRVNAPQSFFAKIIDFI